jgi:hypothetical protein
MTRIVRTAYRHKRPPRRKKPVALEVPAVVRASDPAKPRHRLVAPPERPEEPAPEAVERKPAIVTIQNRKHAAIPAGLLADTPEENRRRGDAADALWRELVRWIGEKT